MKKVLLLTAIPILLFSCSTAQNKHKKYETKTNYASNEIPMYGGQDKSTIIPIKPASEKAIKLGWQYFNNGDHSTAMKRFNQAWMLDKKIHKHIGDLA